MARGTRLVARAGERLRREIAPTHAQEELRRHDAYWWHPSSKHILFVEAEEAPVVTTMLRDPHDGSSAPYRYPFAGTPNVTWRVGVVDVATVGAVKVGFWAVALDSVTAGPAVCVQA